MFLVRAIEKTEDDKRICDEIGAEYIYGTLAYAAAELDENKNIDYYIGICRFIPGEKCRICSLVPKKGFEDDEALIILLRTVMSFLHRAGGVIMTMSCDAGPGMLLDKCGIPKNGNEYEINLNEFFLSPCAYNKEHKNG